MKVLIISHFFPPERTAGAENYAYAVAHELIQLGCQVQVLCAGHWAQGDAYWNGYLDEVYLDIPVRRLNLNWTKASDPNRYLYDNPEVAEFLQDYLTQLKPDVIHVISALTLSARIIGTARTANIPVVVTLTDFWFICPRITLLKGNNQLCTGQTTPQECLECLLFDSRLSRRIDRIIPRVFSRKLFYFASQHRRLNRRPGLRGLALNMAERKRFVLSELQQASWLIAPSRFLATTYQSVDPTLQIHLQSYGHDLSWLNRFPGKTMSSTLRFSYIGQITRIKGVDLLIESFKQLSAQTAISLEIWGDIDQDKSYAQQLRRIALGDDRIRFHGKFAHAEVGDVLAEVDVVVVPSRWYENNPLVIQEAFATGTPVIAADLGGMAEFVQNEVNGLLFVADDSADLARQLQRCVSEPGLIGQLAAAAPVVRSIEDEVAQLIEIYGNLTRAERQQLNLSR